MNTELIKYQLYNSVHFLSKHFSLNHISRLIQIRYRKNLNQSGDFSTNHSMQSFAERETTTNKCVTFFCCGWLNENLLFLKAWQRQSVLGLGLTYTLMPGGKTLQLAQWNSTSPQIQAAVLSRVSDTCLRIWPQPHSRWVWGSFLHLLPNWLLLLLLLLYIFGHLTDQDRVRWPGHKEHLGHL